MSTQDFYTTLGLDRTADEAAIKRAYRRLAAQHHPDRGGSKEEFQRVQQAYDTLSDATKRAAYDNPGPQFHHSMHMNDIFSQMFGGNPFFRGGAFRQQTRMTLWVSLSDVVGGSRRAVTVGVNNTTTMIEIDIPAGIDDGSTVQYSGIAPGGGDLLITFKIHPHPSWHRDGLNLQTEVSVSIWDLIRGGEVEIRDILNKRLSVSIPPRCQPGTILRLRGCGITPRNSTVSGDLLVVIQGRLPDIISEEILSAIEKTKS